MRRRGFQIFTAIFIPILVILGVVVSIAANDQTTLIMTLVMAALYAFYLTRLIPALKKDKEQKAKNTSPLQRR